MRIGIDIRALMEGKTTGVEEYVTNLLHALFRLDAENHYILFANSARPVSDSVYQFHYPNVEYRVTHRSNRVLNFLQKVLRRPRIDRLIGGNIDLFFSPHWRTLALSSGVPLVVTFHDLSFEVMPYFFTPRQRLWHKFMDYRFAAVRADRIIAVSQSTKDDLVRLYSVPKDKVRVIYSGVGSGVESQEVSGLPRQYFLFFGTFEPRKNLAVVIAAYRQYRRRNPAARPLVLAGSSGWKVRLQVPADLRGQVFIFRNVSPGEKKYLFEQAFALLFLSFYEGFGFPILEAAASGVPVISSFSTSLSEIGGDFALLVNPFRPEQVADAMICLEQDPLFYNNLRDRGLAAAARFQWSQSAQNTLQLFRETV